MGVPTSMRYIAVREPGPPSVLTVAIGPAPAVPADGVLIKVEAAGVNRPDVMQRQGKYAAPPGASPILGLEVAGRVVACGPAAGQWQVGDAVCALVTGGGYAEYCAAPGPQCLPVPAGLSMVEAAALPETFFTVWTNVFQRGRLVAGESILIHGGTSGIGTTAIQLAHELGARVFTTVGSEHKRDVARSLGAAVAINYHEQDFVAEVNTATNGGGVNVVLDMVGGSYVERNLAALAEEGRLVQIALLEGNRVSIDLHLVMRKRVMITGSTLRPRTVAEKGAIATALHERVWPLLAAHRVHPVIDSVYPLEDAVAAHERIDSSDHVGKIVLEMGP